MVKNALLLATLLASVASTASLAGDVFSDVVKTMSKINSVPEATVLSDLVTKNAGNAIQSGLASSHATILTLPTISVRGFQIRPIELDPRFQANAARVMDSIDIASLSKQSPIGSSATTQDHINNAATSRCVNLPFRQSVCASIPSATVAGRSFDIPSSSPQEDSDHGRVFGGVLIQQDHDAFADTVALVGNNNNSLCSGVLVSDDTVITAAHCYCGGVTNSVRVGPNAKQPLEKIDIDKPNSSSFLSCDKANRGDLGGGDVAVLKLKAKVTKAQPRTVGDLTKVKAAASVRAVGFGKTPDGTTGKKYQVDIVIASYQCDGKSSNNIPDPQMFTCKPFYELVAAGLNRDTCNGDSGGPIYIFGDDGLPYVVGITSRGTVPNAPCGVGGIYVLLDAPPIRDWLSARGVNLQ